MIGRICEEFGCTPLEAVAQPLPLTLRIIELRQFARVKQAVEAAKTDDECPRGLMAELVFELQVEMRQARGIKFTR